MAMIADSRSAQLLTLPMRGPLPLPAKAGRRIKLPRPACGERGGVRGLPRTDGQLADRSSPGGFGFVHVLGDERRVFELAGSNGANDIGEGEVLAAVFEV